MSLFGDIPILFINMDRHPDRLGHITSKLSEVANVYHRIPGVDGSILAKQSKNKKLEFEMSGMQYQITHASTNIPHKIGCLMSHLECFKFIKDNEYDICIIMEDDLNFTYSDKWEQRKK